MVSKKQAIELLKINRFRLSLQQFRTLKGQVVSGQIEAALKGLDTILRRG